MLCECGEKIAPRRAELGYATCLACGDRQAHAVRWTVVNGHKSSFFVVSNRDELRQLNPKRIGER